MKTKRIAHRIYRITIKGRSFQIDGQNHEYDSKEWQLFEEVSQPFSKHPDLQWIDTYPTKKEALLDISRIIKL